MILLSNKSSAKSYGQFCPPKKIILFGSQARGDSHADSDIDLMVIEETTSDVGQEITRLSRELSKIRFYADLVVATASHYDFWRDTPGNIYYEASTRRQSGV